MTRGLHPPLPGTHASIGDCWQNSGCCHLLYEKQHSFSDTLVLHPIDKDKLPGRLQSRYVSKSRDAGPVNFIGWFGIRDWVASDLYVLAFGRGSGIGKPSSRSPAKCNGTASAISF